MGEEEGGGSMSEERAQFEFTEDFLERQRAILEKLRGTGLLDELSPVELFSIGWVNALANYGLLRWANSDPVTTADPMP